MSKDLVSERVFAPGPDGESPVTFRMDQVFELEDFGPGPAIDHHRKHRDQLAEKR